MYAEQIVRSSDSTCRIGFHQCKETRGSRPQHRRTGSLLENITTRLNNVLAEKFKEDRARVSSSALALKKAVVPRIGHHHLRWCGENRWQYGGGPGAPVQNRCGTKPRSCPSPFALLNNTFVAIGELSRKGGDLIVPKVTSEDLHLSHRNRG